MYLQEEVEKIYNEKGFLSKQDVFNLNKKYDVNFNYVADLLFNLNIPFSHRDLKVLLKKYKIELKNENEVFLEELLIAGNWVSEVFKKSKLYVCFNCFFCKKSAKCRMKNFFKRKYFKNEPVCNDCILKKTTNTSGWKENNSKAQLIAQNKTEQKEKNRDAQLKRFEDEDLIKKYSEIGKNLWKNSEYRNKMEKIAKEKWKNPEYAKKVIQNSKRKYVTGYYKKIYYDSSYELAFLLKLESERGSLECIKRVDFYISYKDKNNKSSCYYPDFILDDKFLIEVKGKAPWIDLENLELKNLAGKSWCLKNNMRFRLVELEDFGYYWLRKALKLHKEIKNGEIKKKNCKEL